MLALATVRRSILKDLLYEYSNTLQRDEPGNSEYLEEFPNQQDVLRYTLTANAPETKDNDFTWKDFQARNNNELVAIFGNFINRVVVLTHKYFGGIVPEPNAFSEVDEETLTSLKNFPGIIGKSVERYRFREASQELMNLARLGNKYLADEEPWKKIKTDEERVKTIMYVALQIAASLAVVSEPFLPFTSSKLKGILNVTSSSLSNLSWNELSEKDVLLASGHEINKQELLFSKIDDKTIVATIVTAYVSNRSAAIPAQSPTLSPTLSAITAGFLGSSSGIPASTFPTKSAPTSAPLVNIPPPSLAKIEIKEAPKPNATSAFTISLSSTPNDNNI